MLTILVEPSATRASARPGMGNIPFDGGCTFRVWAPFASAMAVVFYDRPDQPRGAPSSLAWMTAEENGYWSVDVPDIAVDQLYRFQVTNPDSGAVFTRIDPCSRRVTNSVGLSIVSGRDFAWTDEDFRMPDFNSLVVYELHLGTFDDDPGNRPGTLQRATQRLGQLADLGINCIHLMPPNEFAAELSWGYNVALPFAIEESYGGIDGLKGFVNRAHELGIAVITDCVFNHFGPDDLPACLWQFDGWQERGQGGIYFYNDQRGLTQWGPRPDFGRPEVRRFIRDYVMFLVDECHCDGARIDSTSNIWGFDNGNGWNPEGFGLLRWISDEVRHFHRHPRHKILIAEDWHNDGWVTRPTPSGGAGMDAEWHWFVHAARQALIVPSDESRDMRSLAAALEARFNGDAFQRVIYTESHDESGNDNSLPRKIDGNDPESWFSRKRSTLGAALLLSSPGIPMLWQGQEIHWTERFTDSVPLDWSRLERFGGIYLLYRDLCRLRRNWHNNTRGLRAQHVNCHLVDDQSKVIAYHRWDQGGAGDDVVVILNFSNRTWNEFELGLPRGGVWQCRFSSDWVGYSPDFGNHGGQAVHSSGDPLHGMAHRARFALAPYSALIYSQG